MKRKIALLVSFAALGFGAYAQNNTRPTKKPALFGVHANALDFKTVEAFKEDNSNFRNISKLRDMSFGLSLAYWRGITNKLDFSVRLSGAFHDYAKDVNRPTNKTEFGVELEPSLHIRPFNDNVLVNPFLTAGIGGGMYTGEFAAFVPTGLGLQFNMRSTSYITVQANYRWSLAKDDLKSHLMYSIGFLQNLGPEIPDVVVPPPPPPVVDRDNDGVLDSVDRCPDTPGLEALQGCPDRDGDGIADDQDKCPDQAGTAKYEGCPIPDGDGDGVNDEEDKCPTVAGLARYQGCPIPDGDGDGVNDEEDKCPTRPGPASNSGCPEIAKAVIEKVAFAAKNVFFSTGSYKLLPKSYKSLDEVAKLMKEDETLMIDIDGHTDSQGSNESNQVLSDNRAGAVKEYLMKKGVDASRLKSTGYGEDKPVADNSTAAGRAKNRRTEMTVRNF